MAPDDPELEYYRQVEDLFASLRGAPHVLSPNDFQLLREWWRDGVPLTAVVTGLTEVFARARDREDGDPVVSLSYCRHAVRRHTKRIAAMQIGGPEPSPSPAAAADPDRIAELVAALQASADAQRDRRPAVAGAISAAAGRVATAARDLAPDLLDEHLFTLESTLLQECWRALPEADRKPIDDRVRGAAAASAGSDEARRRSERALRDRELRRLLGLPRLEVGP